MKKAVIIGAGKTGRGFIARLLAEAGREIVFIDRDAALVGELNVRKRYRICFFGGVREPLEIGNYAAYTWADAAQSGDVFGGADLVLVSVGGRNLADVGKNIAGLLPDLHGEAQRRLRVITCENATHPSKTLREAIGREDVCVSEATVFCTTVEEGTLDIASEDYPYLQCDAGQLGGFDPMIPGIRPLADFSNFLTRKLYTYNAASCVIAYLGWLRGYTDYAEAANDPRIRALLDLNYAATNRVLCREFGYETRDQQEFASLSLKKFTNRAITDTVARNAREPHRKLLPDERIIGPAKLLHKYREDASVLEMTAAAALLYDCDVEWNRIKAGSSFERLLMEICGLDMGSKPARNIMKYLARGDDGKTVIERLVGLPNRPR